VQQAEETDCPFDRVDSGVRPAAQQSAVCGSAQGVSGEALGLSAVDLVLGLMRTSLWSRANPKNDRAAASRAEVSVVMNASMSPAVTAAQSSMPLWHELDVIGTGARAERRRREVMPAARGRPPTEQRDMPGGVASEPGLAFVAGVSHA
jgi:hypothetical protein